MILYVSNLSRRISEHLIVEMFERFGSVYDVQLPIDSFTGLPKGYAFVEMISDEEAHDAIDGLNHYLLDGSVIYVERGEVKQKVG
jgi:RNA recognition motif-containing protein